MASMRVVWMSLGGNNPAVRFTRRISTQRACGERYRRRAGIASPNGAPKAVLETWRSPLNIVRREVGRSCFSTDWKVGANKVAMYRSAHAETSGVHVPER